MQIYYSLPSLSLGRFDKDHVNTELPTPDRICAFPSRYCHNLEQGYTVYDSKSFC
jgi:hypothetical protein